MGVKIISDYINFKGVNKSLAVVDKLLPPKATSQQMYSLRPCGHHFQIPYRINSLIDKSFVIRLPYSGRECKNYSNFQCLGLV